MNENKNVPELRFPGFEGEWGLRFIGSVLTIGSGKDYKHLGVGDVPVYGTGGYMLSVNDYLYDGKSVCIGRKGTIDKPRFVEGKFWTVDTLFYTHSYKNSVPEFVYGVFQKINWQKYNEASGVPSLSKTTIEKIKIYLPVVEEQQKIADFLSAVDKKIEQLTEKHRLLTEYKKGVMQQIFSQQIRFKDDEGNEHPEWEEKRLGEVGSIFGGGTPETSQSSYWGGDIQWFTPTEIKQKYISKSNRTISEEGLKKSSAKLLPVGALLLTTRATIADVSIAIKECTTNQGFQSIIVNEQNDNEFLYYWILNNRKKFIRKASGSTFPEISKQEVEKIEGVFPQKEEQQKIADLLTAIDNKIDQAWSKLEQTKVFKKGLLQKVFV